MTVEDSEKQSSPSTPTGYFQADTDLRLQLQVGGAGWNRLGERYRWLINPDIGGIVQAYVFVGAMAYS